MGRIGKFLRLAPADRGLLVAAAGHLALARLEILVLPFRRLAGRPLAEETAAGVPSAGEMETLRRIRWAVETAGWVVPFSARCLPKAIAARRMLRRRGLPSTLYLGVLPEEAGIRSHAWLRCGDFLVTGGGDEDRFTVVSTFG